MILSDWDGLAWHSEITKLLTLNMQWLSIEVKSVLITAQYRNKTIPTKSLLFKVSNFLRTFWKTFWKTVLASLLAQLIKNPPAMRETCVQSLGWEDPLEKGNATHSSILAWRIPWAVQSMRSQRVRQDWATFTVTKTENSSSSDALPLQDTSVDNWFHSSLWNWHYHFWTKRSQPLLARL